MWSHATRAAAEAASQIRFYSAADPNAAADAAWAAADTLHVVAAALGSRVLRQAADSFERAARAPYGRLPRPAPAGNHLRHAARLLAAAGVTSSEPEISYLRLISRLVALARALAEMRMAQQRAAQAGAALQAAEYLHARRMGRAPRAPGERPQDSGRPPSWPAGNFPSLRVCRRRPWSLTQARLAGRPLTRLARPGREVPADSPRGLLPRRFRCSGRGGPALRVGLPSDFLGCAGCRAAWKSRTNGALAPCVGGRWGERQGSQLSLPASQRQLCGSGGGRSQSCVGPFPGR